MKKILSGKRIITAMIAMAAFTIVGSAFSDPYSLDTCPVSGQKLGAMGEPIVKDYDGQEVRFCCSGCPAKFEADRANYQAKIDTKIIAQQKPFYPLQTDVINGHKLGAMGKTIDHVYQNRLIRFSSEGNITAFMKDTAKYLKKLDVAVIEKQSKDYPLESCVVSGEKLGGDMGDTIDFVMGNRLLKLCCKSCVKKVKKDPSKYLKVLDMAAKQGKMHQPEGSGSKDLATHEH